MTSSAGGLAAAYSATGAAWQDGPGRIYDRLAEVLVARCPGLDEGSLVLDLGAGAGAASRAASALGARVIAVDAAEGILAVGAEARPPSCVGDALALPFRAGTFDAVIAAFSLNHVPDPAGALQEAGRVLQPGASIVASAYAEDDTHPVKAAADAAAMAAGWTQADWYEEVRAHAVPLLATVDRAKAVLARTGMVDVAVEHVRVPFPGLRAADLVAWRFGMAQVAPFLATLDPDASAAVFADAVDRLGDDVPTLVRSFIMVVASAPGGPSE